MNTCERQEKKNLLVPPPSPPPNGLKKASYTKNTQASALPLVVKSGTYTVETGEGGGREAEKAVCRSPPFRNQIVY